MRITIVCGFFLPVPPVNGGAVEKMWWRLAKIYARRGHTVTLVSRQWAGWPAEEVRDGVRLLRLRGMDHRRRLWQNLLLDAVWGWRVQRALPPADILVTNTVALPVFVRRLRPAAGRLVVNLNRFPKGQVRWYASAARIQAASGAIAAAAAKQAPALAGRIKIAPNPVDCRRFAGPAPAQPADGCIHLGYLGRIHPEKGLATLVAAAAQLSLAPRLPAWRLSLRGPVDVPRGGGGDAFAARLRALAPQLWADGRITLDPPLFDDAALAGAYHALSVFCYPTEATHGEAHPVAVLEAMAAGLPVIASDLPVFADQLRADENALLVQPGDAAALAAALAALIGNPALRARLGRRARETIWALDDEAVATQHLEDFEALLSAAPA
jgi:glycosyltransferase involved in cell wall biosynthesis